MIIYIWEILYSMFHAGLPKLTSGLRITMVNEAVFLVFNPELLGSVGGHPSRTLRLSILAAWRLFTDGGEEKHSLVLALTRW